jgi:hypothetical protein
MALPLAKQLTMSADDGAPAKSQFTVNVVDGLKPPAGTMRFRMMKCRVELLVGPTVVHGVPGSTLSVKDVGVAPCVIKTATATDPAGAEPVEA